MTGFLGAYDILKENKKLVQKMCSNLLGALYWT
jgi:hypothetical protein